MTLERSRGEKSAMLGPNGRWTERKMTERKTAGGYPGGLFAAWEIRRGLVVVVCFNMGTALVVPVVRNRRELIELQATISGDLYTITKGL